MINAGNSTEYWKLKRNQPGMATSSPVQVIAVTGGKGGVGKSNVSINLALINFLPFPALDGGRLMFLAIEVIRRKPISAKFSNIAHNLGFAILISLMLIITYLDILKLMQ